MNRFRVFLICWSKSANTYLALLHFACGVITWRAAGLLEESGTFRCVIIEESGGIRADQVMYRSDLFEALLR